MLLVVLVDLRMDYFSCDVAPQPHQKLMVLETQHSSTHLNASTQQAQSWSVHCFGQFPAGLY